MLVPVSIMTLVVLSQFRQFEALEPSNNSNRGVGGAAVKENWNGFGKIAVIVSGRSMIFFGLNIFIPIYWIHELGQSKAVGALALSIFAGSGIIGNLFGGNLADRIGPKQVTIIGFIGMTALLPILLMVEQVQLATLLLAPIGFMLFLTYSPTIVLGQKYLPDRVGLSSGVTLGLGVAVGGGVAPLIGWLADLYGVWAALATVASLPLLFLLLALTLPEPLEDEAGGYSSA
jgi:FSR family fosmidomycin resistance protein-like MFS transporter